MTLQCFVVDDPADEQGRRPVVLEFQHYTPRAGGGRGFPPCQPAADGCVAFFGGEWGRGARAIDQMPVKNISQIQSRMPDTREQSKQNQIKYLYLTYLFRAFKVCVPVHR
jgi:hypothetical protein